MSNIESTQTKKRLSTREAATQVGVALSAIQAGGESGVFPAWKSAGGHRRIAIDAIEAIRLRRQTALKSKIASEMIKALVVEDGFEGLIRVGQHAPDLIIGDLPMPEMDGFKMIKRIKMQSTTKHTTITAATALTASGIEARGGLPPGIPVYPKPIPFAVPRPLVEHLISRIAL